MDNKQILELYQLISEGTNSIPDRKKSFELRKSAFQSYSSSGLTKLAFDTRRINQEIEYNPRRGLQNYHRSEQFISEAISQKLTNFAKLKKVLQSLKEQYEKEPEWQDSYARVLLSTLNKGLRTDQVDGDYTEVQPGVGSLDYIEELLYVRYRLHLDNLSKLSESELKKIILDKDEELTRKDVNHAVEITKNDVATQSYDSLMDKLFGGVKATKDNPSVERTVTITIKDSYIDQDK